MNSSRQMQYDCKKYYPVCSFIAAAKKVILYTDMLQLSQTLIKRPVMSLRTGTPVATIIGPIINPNNLKIEGFYCSDDSNRKHTLVLVTQDIRDILPQGFVINDFDVLVEASELVRLQPIIRLNFELLGMHVETVSKEKVGKIEDYATDIDSMFIQKMYVSQSIFKNFSGSNLGIDRTQIVEITPKKVVIHDLEQKVPNGASVKAAA